MNEAIKKLTPKRTWYWVGGVGAAIVALIIVLWTAGVFDAPVAQ